MSFVAVTVQRPSKREGAFLVCDGRCDWDSFSSFAYKILREPKSSYLVEGADVNPDSDLEFSPEACRVLADQLERANEKEPHWAVMRNVDLPAWLTFLRACGGFKIFYWSNDDWDDGDDEYAPDPVTPQLEPVT